jgi:hypothetical protein
MNTRSMNVTPPPASHPAGAAGSPPFRPERWVLLGRSPGWLEAAEAWIKQHSSDDGPLGWRLRHHLVKPSTPEKLSDAFRDALGTEPPVVKVLAEPGAFARADGGVDGVVTSQWPLEAPETVQLLVGDAQAPFDDCAARLSQVDSGPAEFWLLSGRSLWPRICLPQSDEAFEAEALKVFQAWAKRFEASHDPADLDAIYGTAESFEARRNAGPWRDDDELLEQDVDAAERPRELMQPPGALGSRQAGRRMRAEPLAAAAAGSGAKRWPISGVFDKSDPRGTDKYTLAANLKRGPGPATHQLTVQLDLVAARWQGRRRLALEIHTDGHPVLLLHWDDPAGASLAEGVRTVSQTVDLGVGHQEAMQRTVELWLVAADD